MWPDGERWSGHCDGAKLFPSVNEIRNRCSPPKKFAQAHTTPKVGSTQAGSIGVSTSRRVSCLQCGQIPVLPTSSGVKDSFLLQWWQRPISGSVSMRGQWLRMLVQLALSLGEDFLKLVKLRPIEADGNRTSLYDIYVRLCRGKCNEPQAASC